MDQSFSRGIEDRSAIAHEGEYTICDEGIRRRRSVSASDHLLRYAALDLLSLRGGPRRAQFTDSSRHIYSCRFLLLSHLTFNFK